jgi:SAM-dependent methyltransferase
MTSSHSWDDQRETLDDLSEAVNYNRWIYHILRPYLGTRILEIGCGTGNITGFLTLHGQVLAVDVHAGYLRAARKRMIGNPRVTFQKINLEKTLSNLRRFKADTIICVNVLEHIREDETVLYECLRLLPPGGRLLLFVPALQLLFGSLDISYGHFRRYSIRGLKTKVAAAGFKIQYCRYLNLLGILGWWLNGKILNRKVIPKNQILAYDHFVRYSDKIERFLPKPIGLSLFCVGLKRAASGVKKIELQDNLVRWKGF